MINMIYDKPYQYEKSWPWQKLAKTWDQTL